MLRLGELAVGTSGSSPAAASGPPGISPSSTDSAGEGDRGSCTDGDRRGRGVSDLQQSSPISTPPHGKALDCSNASQSFWCLLCSRGIVAYYYASHLKQAPWNTTRRQKAQVAATDRSGKRVETVVVTQNPEKYKEPHPQQITEQSLFEVLNNKYLRLYLLPST